MNSLRSLFVNAPYILFHVKKHVVLWYVYVRFIRSHFFLTSALFSYLVECQMWNVCKHHKRDICSESGPASTFRREEICSDRQVDSLQFLMNAMEGTTVMENVHIPCYCSYCVQFCAQIYPNTFINLSFLLIIVSGKLIYFGLWWRRSFLKRKRKTSLTWPPIR